MVGSIFGASEGRRINCGEFQGILNVLRYFQRQHKCHLELYHRYSGVFLSDVNYHQQAWEGNSKLGYHNKLESYFLRS